MATMKDVTQVIDDRHRGEGWRYHLRPGLRHRRAETHVIHAKTKRVLNQILRHEVIDCRCSDCCEAVPSNGKA